MKSHDNSSLSSGPSAPWSLMERFDEEQLTWPTGTRLGSWLLLTGDESSTKSTVEFASMPVFGCVSQAEAEECLAAEIERVETDLVKGSNRQLRFADGATRYLEESASKRSVDAAWHVRLLIPYIARSSLIEFTMQRCNPLS